jgi:Fe-S oxidoreductase
MAEKDKLGARLSHIRIKEAQEAQADCIVVSCPKCLLMFEDAVKAAGVSEKIIVRDVSELVVEAIGGTDPVMEYTF